MLRKAVFVFLISISFGQVILFGSEGYVINIKTWGASNAKIRLAYHLGNGQYIKDSTFTDISGRCRFTGNTPLSSGVYMVVFPNKSYFEFLLGSDQQFDIEYNASDKKALPRFFGSDENKRFIEYQKNWKSLQEEVIEMSSELKSLDPASLEAINLKVQISEQEKRMKNYLQEVVNLNHGTLLGAIAQSLIPVETNVPDIPVGINKRDSLIRLYSYLSYKKNFFNNTDLSQPGLIRSPILAGKLDQFFKQVVIQIPDSIIKEADRVIEMSKSNEEVFQYVAVWLFNKYTMSEIMGHDAVVVHLADKVYLSGNAPWVSQEYLADLSRRIEKLRPNLIGEHAPELVMNSYAGRYVALYDINAEFTILYFWEPDCGHCKEATPVLKEYYDRNRNKGIEVFAVCTQSDRAKWEQYIREHNLQWINGWDPNRISRYDVLYNIDSTPIAYILDRNKKIIAKRLPVDQISSFIESYRKYNSQPAVSSVR